ncbi:Flp pilus assembly protein TadG [Actinobacillus pleuropneumoniae]|uniref:Flp pilus assembly protein TadG n=1 Tax=Actinobacillus pleuropneumoniae TaxID=715 RepID=UPI0000397E9A|nr:Flp pilus assembly protein TadG [Actinobacillus pleuropneumoniae]MEE3682423.1 pilus assembly protein [Actinobacillus pleuropneumoniae]QSZ38554.1 Flp pilus assembly protein TadG [Actinobacillus pleuropneumoniae]UKH11230.1 pilus assembly protein [Actinobacillus pleuropneumoniae]
MKITSLSQARRFIQDESGVYTVMGGLLALPILALIFVSLESAGIIQDQARLSDSLEQAVLSLTAENNSGRKDNDYKLSGSSNKENDSFDISSEVGKRDNQMVTTFVQAFLPQTNEKAMRLTPTCKTVTTDNKKGHTSSSEVTCTVSGTVEHKSWFPLKVGNLEVIPQQVDVASKSRAFKKNTFNIPIDLMVVADLSGSMNFDLDNKKIINNAKPSKIRILKEVLEELAAKSLFNQDSNNNNRIAVAPFALGAQHSNNQCIIPFILKKYSKDRISEKNIKSYLSANNNISAKDFALSLSYLVDIDKTINSIGGTFSSNSIIFNKNKFCLGRSNKNTHHWYNRDESSNFFSFIKRLHAEGSTLASSGLITASNIMLKEESRSKSLGEQTKRVILVLSDGNDELRLNDEGTPFTQYSRITENLLLGQEEQTTDTYPYFMSKPPKKLTSNINVCDRIRNKLDEHNEDKNTKIVFVEFGYASKAKQAWQHCVGNGNYYSANDKASLLNSFKQAIGETDDVGRSIN